MLVEINKLNEIAQRRINDYLTSNNLSLSDVNIHVEGSIVYVVNVKTEEKTVI